MSNKPCPYCTGKPLSGLYNMRCPGCRVRLVKSARPSRQQQEAMLEYIRFAWGVDTERETRADLQAQRAQEKAES